MADDGTTVDMYGNSPIGWMTLTASGRVSAILMASDRQVPKNDTDIVGLFNSMTAYTGSWRIEGDDRLVTSVDSAWHPAWMGTDQVRYFTLIGDTLKIRTAKQTHPAHGTRELFGVVTWHRAG